MNIHATPTHVGSISFMGMNAHCIGAARDEEYVVYLSMVGYRTANKALWAALMEKRNSLQIGKNLLVKRMEGSYLHDEKQLAKIPMSHTVMIHHQASVLHNEPDKDFYVLYNDGDDATERFYTMLNRAVSLPMLPEWGRFLFDWGVGAKLITTIHATGIKAFKVNPDPEAWTLCIQQGIEKGRLK